MTVIHSYYPLIASLLSMIISQTIKLILMAISKKKINLESLTRSGGMPSSHSALITSITLSIGLQNGFDSSHFFVSLALSMVVIYDARGIRHTVGKHAKLLNETLTNRQKKLNEHIGHTLPEIIAGICLGIIVSLAMFNLKNF
jgi:acid phosphatase family membrane protein YuiD